MAQTKQNRKNRGVRSTNILANQPLKAHFHFAVVS